MIANFCRIPITFRQLYSNKVFDITPFVWFWLLKSFYHLYSLNNMVGKFLHLDISTYINEMFFYYLIIMIWTDKLDLMSRINFLSKFILYLILVMVSRIQQQISDLFEWDLIIAKIVLPLFINIISWSFNHHTI